MSKKISKKQENHKPLTSKQNTIFEKQSVLMTCAKLLGAWIITILIVFGLLFLTAQIPQKSIMRNVDKSSEFLNERQVFYYKLVGPNQIGFLNTLVDHYADSISVNILYHMDSSLKSVIASSYYEDMEENVNTNLQNSIQNKLPANYDYFRYWHAYLIILRPLFLFLDLRGATLVLGAIALFLHLCISYQLWQSNQKIEAVLYCISLLCVNAWMILFCLEYIMPFLISGIVTNILIRFYQNKKLSKQRFLMLMMLSGTLCTMFDFLTTETLTFTIPVMCLLLLDENQKLYGLIDYVKAGFVWALSYGLTFLAKWGLSAMVLGNDSMQKAIEAGMERAGGSVKSVAGNSVVDINALQKIEGALSYNFNALFPNFEYWTLGHALLFMCITLMIIFVIFYLFRKPKFEFKQYSLFLLVGMIPYLRYFVLNNHAYLHYFFAYRAQLTSVFVLLFIGYRGIIKK